jgi:hypothetical protein
VKRRAARAGHAARASVRRAAPPPRVPNPDLVLQLGPDKLAVLAESLVENCLRLRVDIIDLQGIQYMVLRALLAAGLPKPDAIARARMLVRAALLRLADDDTSYIPAGDGVPCEDCDASPFEEVLLFEGA